MTLPLPTAKFSNKGIPKKSNPYGLSILSLSFPCLPALRTQHSLKMDVDRRTLYNVQHTEKYLLETV